MSRITIILEDKSDRTVHIRSLVEENNISTGYASTIASQLARDVDYQNDQIRRFNEARRLAEG